MKRIMTIAIAATLLMSGCSAATVSPQPEAAPQIEVGDIATIEDGLAWAQGLDDTVAADELSEGIIAIGDLVPHEEIWFATNNEIGIALIELNRAVLEAPDRAGTKVDDLLAIVEDIEVAIERGLKPPA